MKNFDLTRVELIDLDDPTEPVSWSGALTEFVAANTDAPLSDDERSSLTKQGHVIVGGGAAAAVLIRHPEIGSAA
jgi:hypothetical protein